MLKFWKAHALVAILMLGLFACFTPRAAAQDTMISGTLLDLEGKPWADCPLTLENDQGVKTVGKTDKNGKYQFGGLKGGTFKISLMLPLQKDPYVAAQLKVNSGQSVPADLNLQELVAKKNPEYMAALKKQGDEGKKFAGMKEHFTKGMGFLEQERTARDAVAKAPADQKDAAKAKVTEYETQAVAEFQEAQKVAPEKDPNLFVMWARLGEAYDMAGQNEEAINAYQQAVVLKPDNAGYYNNLGNVLARVGKIDEAKAAYVKSAELDPPNAAQAWRNFGISLYQANRMVEAIEPLQKATQLDPKSAQAWFLLGNCMVADPSIYKTVGDKIEVNPRPGTAEAFQKAIELDPNGTWGTQAKAGLEQLQQLTGGIETKVGGKKKK